MSGVARYRVIHETRYRYPSAVASTRQVAHLTPRNTDWQKRLEHHIGITPTPSERSEDEDYFGNHVTRFAHDAGFDEQIIRAESLVEVQPHAPALTATSPDWRSVREACADGTPSLRFELAQFLTSSSMAPALAQAAEYAQASLHEGGPWLAGLLDLTARVHNDFVFDPAATTLTTPVQEVIEKKRGVCQDFAHLMVSCLRSVGLPARYVSGYILTHPPAGQPRLIGADASHAWVSAYCPELGWVDFDPTNGKLADTEFITLGWGRDFLDVTPLRGVVLGSGAQEMEVRVTVMPLDATLSSSSQTQAQSQSCGPEGATMSSGGQAQSQIIGS